MPENPNSKTRVYDLEERTFQFAKAVRLLIKRLPKTIANFNYIKVKIVGILNFWNLFVIR